MLERGQGASVPKHARMHARTRTPTRTHTSGPLWPSLHNGGI